MTSENQKIKTNLKRFDYINSKKFACIITMTLVSVLLSGCLNQGDSSTSNKLQKAIDAANIGDTVFIESGIYHEQIVINKTITLIGEEKNTTILIPDLNKDMISTSPIINITADHCVIENLQINLNNRSFDSTGIFIHSQNVTIKNIVIMNATNGIELAPFSGSNTIIHNSISNNYRGIESYSSSYNNISQNIFSNNSKYHLHLSTFSDYNNISYNTMNRSNTAIYLKGSKNNNIFHNCILNNQIGLFCCCAASFNTFYRNILINNTESNAIDGAGPNNWYYFPHGPGNYWDNYTGTDDNHDGIGDTVYQISDVEILDKYPLMNPPDDTFCDS